MSVTKTLPPSLMAVLVEQVAAGRLKQASVVSNINADIPVTYQQASARFVKDSPGSYSVFFYRDAQEVGHEKAASPVEAKLLVLDYVVSAAKEAAPA